MQIASAVVNDSFLSTNLTIIPNRSQVNSQLAELSQLFHHYRLPFLAFSCSTQKHITSIQHDCQLNRKAGIEHHQVYDDFLLYSYHESLN